MTARRASLYFVLVVATFLFVVVVVTPTVSASSVGYAKVWESAGSTFFEQYTFETHKYTFHALCSPS